MLREGKGSEMKRSEINRAMRDAVHFMEKQNFRLPPFAYWKKEDWQKKGAGYEEIRDNMLGWDITDFGWGNFDETGLLMFTLRNGSYQNPEKYEKPYAEKILVVKEGQVTPFHFHWKKIEDIINRGGGDLVVQLYESMPDGEMSRDRVSVHVDGYTYRAEVGVIVRLKPGESICIPCGQYHKFWGEGGDVLVGEVSRVNDDRTDNHFYEEKGGFPRIEEDEEPLYYLFSEEPEAL